MSMAATEVSRTSAAPTSVKEVQALGTEKPPKQGTRFTNVVAGLTLVRIATTAAGFITGPLLARSLGASGRGDLAAVLVPLSLLPAILSFGIAGYVFRVLPKGERPEEVLTSLALPLLAISVIGLVGAVPAADALAGGRDTVRTYLIVVFLSTPALLVSNLLSAALAALGRWSAVIVNYSIPFAVGLGGTVVLYAVGDLTVATAAAVNIAGSVLSAAAALPMVWRLGRPVYSRTTAARAIVFGAKSWIGGLALLANLRLDQFLMITAVSPRVLGLYAVATTISSTPAVAAGALTQPLMRRVAAGEVMLIPSAVRITVAASVVINVVMAAITPTLLRLLFGSGFEAALPMALVLFVAAVPACGSMVLSSALQADGAPLIPTYAEGLALVITVIGLAALLGPIGGMGAAITSLAAYSTSFVFQLVAAARRLQVPRLAFVLPTREDVRWLLGYLSQLLGPSANRIATRVGRTTG